LLIQSNIYNDNAFFFLDTKKKNASAPKICKDYHTGGFPMAGRTFNANKYRHGFNGQEKDDEVKGEGNSINYTARIYDPRLMRFLSVDPLTKQFPFYSPYQFAGNKPIWAIDLDGKEEYIRTKFYSDGQHYKTEISVVSWAGSPNRVIVHDSQVNSTATGNTKPTATYDGSSTGDKTTIFSTDEQSAIEWGPRRTSAGSNVSFGPGGDNGNTFGYNTTPPNSNAIEDVQTGAAGQNEFKKGPNTVTIPVADVPSVPNLPTGINAVPENVEDRGQKTVGGSSGDLSSPGSPGAMGKDKSYEYQPSKEYSPVIIGSTPKVDSSGDDKK
jgi:RHS repeat-associated protein